MKEYLKILSNEIPDFLNDYINTPQMQKLSEISVSCGTYYTKLFDKMVWYSSLDHSIAVSLIVWNFTKDKKQTIAGLFHDIATPVFKHSIDFMNGDYKKQESTEELTTQIIRESKEIMSLLQTIKNLSCEEMTVEFATCLSGRGDAGVDLQTELESFFGSGVNVILYAREIKFYFNKVH